MPKQYYTLLVRYEDRGPWCIEFGDYVRRVVEEERMDRRDHGEKARNLKIVSSLDTQESIERLVNALNA